MSIAAAAAALLAAAAPVRSAAHAFAPRLAALRYGALDRLPAGRFVFVPWQYTPAEGPAWVPYHEPGPNEPGDRDPFSAAPPPRKLWMRAPDPAGIGFDRFITGPDPNAPRLPSGRRRLVTMPAEGAAAYFYFRTTLAVPPGVRRRPVYLYAPEILGTLRVMVDGRRAPQLRAGSPLYALGTLAPGPNSIVLALEGSALVRIQHAGFVADYGHGRVLFARLPVEPPESRPTPLPAAHPYPAARLRFPPSTALPRDRFVFAPWEGTTAGGDAIVPIPKSAGFGARYDAAFDWLPPPDPGWKPTADPRVVGVIRKTEVPCNEGVAYAYFRTTLNLPPSFRGAAAYAEIGDSGLLVANGHATPPSRGIWREFGASLHPGPNSIVVATATTCNAGSTGRVRFFAGDRSRLIEAVLPNEAAPSPLWPRPGDARGREIADAWLRPRRDGENSAHSTTPPRLPLRQTWSARLNVIDARIRGGTALVQSADRLLTALDVATGAIRWSRRDAIALGDVSESGEAALLVAPGPTPGTGLAPGSRIVVVDADTGSERWTHALPDPVGIPSIHDGILYAYGGSEGLLRLRARDGAPAALPVPTREGSWGGQVAFAGDQIIFGDGHDLKALRLDDPRRGTRFYDGGTIWPVVSGPFVVLEGWYYAARSLLRDGKWLRDLWGDRTGRGPAHCWAPVGPFGAILLEREPNDEPGGLTLYDMPTGRIVWSAAVVVGGAISAGDAIVDAETELTMPRWEALFSGKSDRRSVLAIRDAATGRIRWSSAEFNGTPLAAAGGRVLVACGGTLRCLR